MVRRPAWQRPSSAVLCLLGAPLVAPGASVLPVGRGRATCRPATASGARASCLFSRRLRRPLRVQAHLVANVLAVAKQAVPKLKGDWDVVQALYLKSAESVALPLYQRPSGSKE